MILFPKDIRRVVIKPIRPLVTITQLNTRPVAHRHMDIPALANVSFNAFVSILKLKRFKQIARMTQYIAATTEHSVGVKIPVIMPSTRIAGPPSAGSDVYREWNRSPQDAFGARGQAMCWVFTAIGIQIIMATPIRTPGPIPAWNIASVEVWLKNAQTTKLMDGGIIGPIPADAAVTATEKSGSYPAFDIALTSMVPSPPASARAEPDIPANTMEDNTLACASPPGR